MTLGHSVRIPFISPLAKFWHLRNVKICQFGDDVPKLEPKKWLNFRTLDKSIQELRAIYKVHPEWFETPKPKSDKEKNELDYSI